VRGCTRGRYSQVYAQVKALSREAEVRGGARLVSSRLPKVRAHAQAPSKIASKVIERPSELFSSAPYSDPET
jgi:hypothetical protein